MGSSIRRDECPHPVSDRRNNRLRRSQRLAEFLISNDNENLGVDKGRVNHGRGIRGERELVDGRVFLAALAIDHDPEMVIEVPGYRGIVLPVRTEYDLTDCTTLDCVAARDFLAIDHQEREWMEVSSTSDGHHNHVAHRRDVNGEIECFRYRSAVEQQLRAIRRGRFLRVQVFTVGSPLRSASLIWRWFAVNDEHPGFLLVDVIPDVGVVVSVRTESDSYDWAAGNLRLTVENKARVSPIGWSFHMQACEESG